MDQHFLADFLVNIVGYTDIPLRVNAYITGFWKMPFAGLASIHGRRISMVFVIRVYDESLTIWK